MLFFILTVWVCILFGVSCLEYIFLCLSKLHLNMSCTTLILINFFLLCSFNPCLLGVFIFFPVALLDKYLLQILISSELVLEVGKHSFQLVNSWSSSIQERSSSIKQLSTWKPLIVHYSGKINFYQAASRTKGSKWSSKGWSSTYLASHIIFSWINTDNDWHGRCHWGGRCHSHFTSSSFYQLWTTNFRR